jgi:hypothetical protein
MAGIEYDSLSFEQKHLKMPEVKIFLCSMYSSQNVLYLVKSFYFEKKLCRRFFNQKVRASTCFWWCFAYFGWLGVLYDSWMTNKSVARGKGALTGSPPFFLLVAPVVRLHTFYVAMKFNPNRPRKRRIF